MSKTCLVCLNCDDQVVIKENIYNCQCKFHMHPACFEEYKKKCNSCIYCRQPQRLFDADFQSFEGFETHPMSFRRFDDLLDPWYHEPMIRSIHPPQLIYHLRLYRHPPLRFFPARFQYLEYRYSF